MSSRCRICQWDSEFFGRRIAQIEGSRLSMSELAPILQWCAAERIECLYFLADSRCSETLQAVENAGFGFKDLRVTYERSAADPHSALFSARPVCESDIETVVAIARTAHTDSRFFFDQKFDPIKAALLFEMWLRKACADSTQIVFTTEIEGVPAGYLSCNMGAEGTGQIGLAAVASHCQGKGLGGNLMAAALDWFARQRASRIFVVTQGRNIDAQRFYQKHGFRIRSAQSWYHKWFAD